MIKVDDNLYDFKVAVPLIISLLAFQETLPENVLFDLAKHPEETPLRDKLKKNSLFINKSEGNVTSKTTPSKMSRKDSFGSDSDMSSMNGKVRKTLRPSRETLLKLDLKLGENVICYKI